MNRVREIRKEQDKPLRVVAEAADISIQFLADIERGRRTAKRKTWERIASALGKTVEELKGGDEDAAADH